MRTPDLPQTVEFRQAKGSLNGEDNNHWVDFCIEIVKLAHQYAADPESGHVVLLQPHINSILLADW